MERLKRIGKDYNGKLIYISKEGRFYQRFDIGEDAIFVNLPLPRDYCPHFELLFPMDFIIKAGIDSEEGDKMVKLKFLGIFDNIEGGRREIYVSEEGEYYYKVVKGNEEHYYPIRSREEKEYINMHLKYIESKKIKNKKENNQN
ncbi:MAG: hypothetical protein QXJ20_02475 [Candidatus Aenigmatarchaeota archaeon]